MDITSLIQKTKTTQPEEQDLIRKAFLFAKQAHGQQRRASGEPYITHPVAVAGIAADLNLDSATVAACLLHDVLEDTAVTKQEIEKEFGPEISFLVDGVTKLAKIEPHGQSGLEDSSLQLQAQSLRRMFFSMAEDVRVILIKLADRYHNMKTVAALSPERRRRLSLETLEIYAPIAERLGMGQMKGELEDLSFPHAFPKDYHWLMDNVQDKYLDRQKYLAHVQPLIIRELENSNLKIVDAHSRAKHYYSLYKKLAKRSLDLSLVYDLVALRIILPSIPACYEALGIIHKKYKPLPGLIKDYIALPKLNGYRSIHTTIFAEQGRVLEIQLRTPEMHEHAENGIAAHWSYSESGKNKLHAADLKEARWISKLKEWMKNSDSQEWYQSLQTNFFSDRIFVFTPRGEVKDLPEGSTPLDFAYAIHTNLGHTTAGARINGRLVALGYPLKNGEMVEIIKNHKNHPSLDWLKLAKTSEAKKKILSWLKQYQPDSLPVSEKSSEEKEKSLPAPPQSLPPSALLALSSSPARMAKPFLIRGQENVLSTLAKCCAPLPGDKIMGYVTKHRGVSIHHWACSNVPRLNVQKVVEVSWPQTIDYLPLRLILRVKDKIGLIEEIGKIMKDLKINILEIKNSPPEGGVAEIKLALAVKDSQHAKKLFQKIEQNKSILTAKKVA